MNFILDYYKEVDACFKRVMEEQDAIEAGAQLLSLIHI